MSINRPDGPPQLLSFQVPHPPPRQLFTTTIALKTTLSPHSMQITLPHLAVGTTIQPQTNDLTTDITNPHRARFLPAVPAPPAYDGAEDVLQRPGKTVQLVHARELERGEEGGRRRGPRLEPGGDHERRV